MFGGFPWGMSPIIDAFRISLMLLLLAPLYVMLDSLRPWRHEVEKHFDEPKEGMMCYFWMGGILFIVGVAPYVPSILERAGIFIGPVPGIISGLGLFFMVVLLFAYVKRVVLNKTMRRYRKEMNRQKRLEAAGETINISRTKEIEEDSEPASDNEESKTDSTAESDE
ncbi:MAG: hypothetical protein FWC86_05185 [Coriobacteriia bacterium]|nr:hypothetical protein [Coriobacteriia bacterium]